MADVVTDIKSIPKLTKEDFVSDQMVKWCPGCGDHAILASFQKVLPEVGVKKEDIVVVSGIGCSSRFPYYVKTYGFHGIHGRAAALSTGIKIANPNLHVWMVTGDGDSLAIGGNHFIHVLRRNIDINIMLFNNRIYGLTKGQYSPTTPTGKVTKTSPQGTIEHPFTVGELAIGAQGTFFARAVDTNPKMMTEIMLEASKHKGTSLIEILQNCVIFYNKVHSDITSRETRDDNQIYLKHGEPMLFGKEKNKGIILKGTKLEVVTIGENGITEKDILVHDKHQWESGIHLLLATMKPPEYPMALGVIRSVTDFTYDDKLEHIIESEKASSPIQSVDDLLNSGKTWDI
ncbi:MAG: 2-oxoacid:ferredoxin oxidoreductase subunit beta [Bacteroidetes bacterium 4484_249]|nr:MAG: 2-oxoacid:ferredoxin oxidoreductase subunit beta [Bacteroidetes bacterium 4484_249]